MDVDESSTICLAYFSLVRGGRGVKNTRRNKLAYSRHQPNKCQDECSSVLHGPNNTNSAKSIGLVRGGIMEHKRAFLFRILCGCQRGCTPSTHPPAKAFGPKSQQKARPATTTCLMSVIYQFFPQTINVGKKSRSPGTQQPPPPTNSSTEAETSV